MSAPAVDLVVNVFERTLDLVLEPGYFETVAAEHQHDFASRTLLINNVDDLASTLERAEDLRSRGEISRYLIVAEHFDAALRRTGLRRSDFGAVVHTSDCSLVAICATGPEWLCYLDAEARLRRPASWIDLAIAIMDSSPRILSGSPQWEHKSGVGKTATIEADARVGDVTLDYGFSDQAFLVRRRDLQTDLIRRPLWLTCPAALWHPSHRGYFLETILEAYSRRKKLPRLVVLSASLVLDASNMYHPENLRERVRRKRDRLILEFLDRHEFSDPRYRLPIPRGVDPHDIR